MQRNMLSLLNSDLSLLVKSEFGTGKSLANALYLLSNTPAKHAQNTPFITNLLLVPTPYLAVQYYKIFAKLLKNSREPIHNVVQYVFRDKAECEQKQIDLLKTHPGPQILIGTPTRILDILSSDNRLYLPLHKLSYIALDDADQLIPSRDFFAEVRRKNNSKHDHSKNIPTLLLLNHIIPVRNTYMRQERDVFIPLKFLMESSTAGNYLKVVAMRNKWIEGRPMLRLGTDSIGGEYRNRMPNDVNSYFVSYNPLTDELTDTNYDVSSVIPQFDSKSLDVISELNARRLPKHVSDYAAMSKSQRLKTLSLYSSALAKTIQSDSEQDSHGNRRRALVVVPEAFPIKTFAEVLEETVGIKSARLDTQNNTCGFFYRNGEEEVEVDSETFFKQLATEGSEYDKLPQVLLVRAKQCPGVDLPGLGRIYALSWDSILSTKLYQTVAGRCRVAPTHERGETEAKGHWKPAQDPEQGKIVVVSLIEETNDMRYNMLIAGSMFKSGIQQTKFFDKK